jgi:hypothetical protein
MQATITSTESTLVLSRHELAVVIESLCRFAAFGAQYPAKVNEHDTDCANRLEQQLFNAWALT